MRKLANIFSNILKPGYTRVMLDKVKKRILEPNLAEIKTRATNWYATHAIDTLDYLNGIDPALTQESVEFNKKLQTRGQDILSRLPVKMGGGGNCVLLYFLARHIKPKVIVETGVSMGFSSQTFLSSLQLNGHGHLYSSDFPYFRLPDPEKYIGCVVEEHLKANWTLLIEGDHKNLTAISEQITSIGLFHYDSDKSYAGRSEALIILKEKLIDATVVFDDIGDNFHFRDFCKQAGQKSLILKNPVGGYVGLTGAMVNRGI